MQSQPFSNHKLIKLAACLDSEAERDQVPFSPPSQHFSWTRCWGRSPQGYRDDEDTVIALGSFSRVGFGGLTPEGALGYLIIYPLWRIHCLLGVCGFAEEAIVTQGREMAVKEAV